MESIREALLKQDGTPLAHYQRKEFQKKKKMISLKSMNRFNAMVENKIKKGLQIYNQLQSPLLIYRLL